MTYLGHMTTEAVGAGRVPKIELKHRLRIARESMGLQQGELADRMGVARNTVSRSESGAGVPRPVVIRAWALATGVDAGWLETGVVKQESPSPDGEELSGRCTPRDLNPEPIDIRSLLARRAARSLDATGESAAA